MVISDIPFRQMSVEERAAEIIGAVEFTAIGGDKAEEFVNEYLTMYHSFIVGHFNEAIEQALMEHTTCTGHHKHAR